MTGFDARCRQAREFREATRFLDANPCAPLHDTVRTLVERCPSLGFEYLSILIGDWSVEFRTEHQSEIDAALQLALTARTTC